MSVGIPQANATKTEKVTYWVVCGLLLIASISVTLGAYYYLTLFGFDWLKRNSLPNTKPEIFFFEFGTFFLAPGLVALRFYRLSEGLLKLCLAAPAVTFTTVGFTKIGFAALLYFF